MLYGTWRLLSEVLHAVAHCAPHEREDLGSGARFEVAGGLVTEMIAGWLARALATATRCCSDPSRESRSQQRLSAMPPMARITTPESP